MLILILLKLNPKVAPAVDQDLQIYLLKYILGCIADILRMEFTFYKHRPWIYIFMNINTYPKTPSHETRTGVASNEAVLFDFPVSVSSVLFNSGSPFTNMV